MYNSLSTKISYHLQSASPAHNTATNSQCALKDFDGIARPQESVCDIEAYEFRP